MNTPAARAQELLEKYRGLPDLLVLLDAFVQANAEPSGLSGKVAIGVRAATGAKWWTVELGRAVRTTFSDAPDRDVHAALLLGAADAEAIARGRRAPSFDAHAFGDRALLRGVLDRFLKPVDPISVRRS